MRKLTILLIALVLTTVLSACGNTNGDEPQQTYESTTTSYNFEELQGNMVEQNQTFTVEQIQLAMEPQFRMGIPPQEPQQVIAVERVERVREGFRPEGAGPGSYIYDLTNSMRYMVTYRFVPYPEDYDLWMYSVEFFANDLIPHIRRDGNFIIITEYFYFNDVNGEPELAFVSC